MPKVLTFAVPVTAAVYPLFPNEPDDTSFVQVKVATVGDMGQIQLKAAVEKRTINEDRSVTIEGKPYVQENDRAFKAFLLMVDCNLQRTENVPLFAFKDGKFAGSFEDFLKVWNIMPVELADKIFDRVIECNPTLDPNA